MKRLIVMALTIIVLVASCSKPNEALPENYADVLDIKNVPTAAEDWSAYSFSDLGAWFGFALPDSGHCPGGFVGPFLMTSGKWLGPSIMGLILQDAESGSEFDWADASCVIEYLPGRLHQSYKFIDLSVSLDLVFISNRSALMRAVIISDKDRFLNISYRGKAFSSLFSQSADDNRMILDLAGTDEACIMLDSLMSWKFDISNDSRSYRAYADAPAALKKDRSFSMSSVFALTFKSSEWPDEKIIIERALKSPNKMIDLNKQRWAGYLRNVLESKISFAARQDYMRVAVKSLMTLVHNWKCARGDLLHDGFFPSAAAWYFNGFWGWDTWKIAAAWAVFAPDVAKDGIRAMFDYQNEYGMIADVIYADKRENNWRDTKPPLAAWAIWSIYENDHDIAFLDEMWPKLKKFHQWWYNERDHDGNGLCEYGSTDGTLIAAKWESGMDDGLRYDATSMLKNSDTAWSMDQESVDLNSYLCMDKDYLALIATVLSKNHEAVRYSKEALELRKRIRAHFWDEEDGYFYDIRLKDRAFIKVKGPEGWIPLTWNIATEEQASMVRAHMMDSLQFATYIPFPTIPADHKKFMTGYWRGPVWLDQAGFAVSALRNYGYIEDAGKMMQMLFERPVGLFNADAPIYENYDPRNGDAMKAPYFSWSAAHYVMMFQGR
ncbi:glycoside hydrolase [bacterium]|nr:glycoside hydrolase [bacterium]